MIFYGTNGKMNGYFEKSMSVLEFDRITVMLADCCPTDGAKGMALTLAPDCNADMIKKRLRLTTEAKALIASRGFPPFENVSDVTDAVERAGKGGTLSMAELLKIASLMTVSRRLYGYYFNGDDNNYGEMTVSEHFGRLTPCRQLEDGIRKAVLAEDMMSDDASPLLADIRRKIRLENIKIRENLQKYAGGQFGKYLQENIVTIRNGRYVVPVKSEYKNEVKGLVHDTSASGATFFIEPMAIVDSNNELKTLESREAHEIDRILAALSAQCADYGSAISGNCHAVTELAFIFGKAELSYRMKGNAPEITEDRKILYKNARHPLIDKNRVVPVTVELGGGWDTMIITGPNTGGKTVTLKTIGLLTLMAQAGLHIPADEGSETCVFDSVLADIGDEQSIEQSLSTFSAHMKNTVDILEKLGPGSLALFDELGAGTDPTEGAALAAAIIEKVRSRGALCAATTHYSEIKAYAVETDGVVNASCEFDVNTLQPTYRLLVGAPGKSNAFAISSKLGLPDDVIKNAEKRLTENDLKFENVLQKLENSRKEAENERNEAARLRRELEKQMNDEYQKARQEREKAERELEKSREKAQRILESAKATEEYVLNELEKIKKEQQNRDYSTNIEEARREMRRRLRQTGDSINPVTEDADDSYVLPRPLKKGDFVLIANLRQSGTVVTLPDKKGNLTVRTGMIDTRTNVKNVRLTDEPALVRTKDRGTVAASEYSGGRTADFSPELDIRGYNGEEGWAACDRYIDEAVMAGVEYARIIHGKGSGLLRNAIWARLKSDRRVKSFRPGVFGEGDNGVTVIELKK